MFPARSDVIAELAKALCKMQSQMEVAKRASENPFFKSSYADLASVWKAIQKPMTDNGLCFTQRVWRDGELVIVTTDLMHTSGEYMRSDVALKIPVMMNKEGKFYEDPQKLGSIVTYLRRYALAAIVGLAVEGEDDDAEGASSTMRNGKLHHPEMQRSEPIDKQKSSSQDEPLSDPQRKKLWAMGMNEYVDKQLITKEEFIKFIGSMMETYGSIGSPEAPGAKVFTKAGASALIKDFKTEIEAYIAQLNEISH
jgi:hypothetical protein